MIGKTRGLCPGYAQRIYISRSYLLVSSLSNVPHFMAGRSPHVAASVPEHANCGTHDTVPCSGKSPSRFRGPKGCEVVYFQGLPIMLILCRTFQTRAPLLHLCIYYKHVVQRHPNAPVRIYTSACPMNMLSLTSETTSLRSSLPTSTMPLPRRPIRPARPRR